MGTPISDHFHNFESIYRYLICFDLFLRRVTSFIISVIFDCNKPFYLVSIVESFYFPPTRIYLHSVGLLSHHISYFTLFRFSFVSNCVQNYEENLWPYFFNYFSLFLFHIASFSLCLCFELKMIDFHAFASIIVVIDTREILPIDMGYCMLLKNKLKSK